MRSRLLTIARVFAAVAAVLALAAAVFSIPTVAAAGDATIMVETWRMIGFFTFAALFGYLAACPTRLTVWVIVLVNKLALTIAALALGTAAAGTMSSAIWDGILTVILATGTTLALLARKHRDRSARATRPAVS